MSFVSSLTQQLPASTQTGLPVGSMYPSSQMNSQTYLSRVPSLPENIYGTSHLYPPSSAGTRPDTSGYYPARNPTESLKAPSAVGQHYYVDHMMNPHPYSSLYPFDINAVRRKNATRETTGPLKAWLKQHRQNPYPTKGEKVMLAISTRMTLTQVSTWFANARRRMKKDKFDDEDEDKEELEDLDDDKKRKRSGSVSSRVSHSSSDGNTSKDLSDFSDAEELNIKNRPTKKCVQRLFSPEMRHDHVIDQSSSPESLPERPQSIEQAFFEPALPAISESIKLRTVTDIIPEPHTSSIPSQKPKIWSISEIIGSATKTVDEDFTSNYNTSVSNFSSIPASYSAYSGDYYQIPVTDYSYQDQLQVYPHQELAYGLPRTQVSPTERIQYL